MPSSKPRPAAADAVPFVRDSTGVWREARSGREVRVWQRFLSGRRLNLLDPTPFDFEDDDLARGLAREARWNGQTRGDYPFSVAQHCCEVLFLMRRTTSGSLLTRELELAALLHDASEGLGTRDIITPMKAILGERWQAIDERLQRVVHARYGLPEILPAPWKAAIKKADRILAATEAHQLAAYTLDEVHDPKVLGNPEKPRRDLALTPWPPEEARRRFLGELNQLLGRKA